MYSRICVAARIFAFSALTAALLLGAGPARAADNVGVVEIANPGFYSQVAAISDVHGEYLPVRKLLTQAGLMGADGKWAAGRTLLVVVGDSMDKGPESLEVLELWQDLGAGAQKAGGRVVVLLGNHEAEYLANPAQDHKSDAVYAELKQRGLPNEALSDTTRRIDDHALGAFLRDLPVAARVGRWLFCHAGWIAKPAKTAPASANWSAFRAQAQTLLRDGRYSDPFFLDKDSILEKNGSGSGGKWWKSPDEVQELEQRLDGYGLRGVVLGHKPAAFGLDQQVGPYRNSRTKNRFFKIDSGMAPVAGGDSDGNGGKKAARDGYPGHLLLFTRPAELNAPQGPDFAHVLSVGFDPLPGGGFTFARKAVTAATAS